VNDSDASNFSDCVTLGLGRRPIEMIHGRFEIAFFRDQPRGKTAMAIFCGDLATRLPLLTRVHSSCLTSECLMASDCDCADQLERSFGMIAEQGRGVVFYLMQEGRGAGLSAKARDRMMVQASGHRLTTFDAYAEMGLPSDLRRYDCVGPMAQALGILGPLELLTNNPEKAAGVAASVASHKIEIFRTRKVEGPTSPFNRDYLQAKRQSGHALGGGGRLVSAFPPERIEVEGPGWPSVGSHLISTAHYFLPVELGAARRSDASVDWFRMRVIHDRRTGRESVLLSLGASRNAAKEMHWGLSMTLMDRLPCAQARGRAKLRETLLAIRERGEGRVVIHFEDENPEAGQALENGVDMQPGLTEEILAAVWPTARAGGEVEDADG